MNFEITAESELAFTGQVEISAVATENIYERITGTSVSALIKFVNSMGLSPNEQPPAVIEAFDQLEKDAEKETAGYRLITPKGMQWSLSASIDGRMEGKDVVITRMGTPTIRGTDIRTVGVVPGDQLPPGTRVYQSQEEADRAFDLAYLKEMPARVEKTKAVLQRETEAIDRQKQTEVWAKEELQRRLKAIFPVASYTGNLRYFGDYPVIMEIDHLKDDRFQARIALVILRKYFRFSEAPARLLTVYSPSIYFQRRNIGTEESFLRYLSPHRAH